MSDVPEKAKRDGPRFRRVEQRRRVALAKYYGTGSEPKWEIPKIADYLNVSTDTIEDYIFNSEMGDRMREMFPAAEERMKMDILLDKKERLDALRSMFWDKLEESEVAVTGHRMESVSAHPDFDGIQGLEKPDTENAHPTKVIIDTPVPDDFDERAALDEEARALLREIRKHENDIRDMMSLDQPDEVKTEHTGDAVVEQKIYNFDGADDSLPDAEVIDIESEEVEVEADTVGDAE